MAVEFAFQLTHYGHKARSGFWPRNLSGKAYLPCEHLAVCVQGVSLLSIRGCKMLQGESLQLLCRKFWEKSLFMCHCTKRSLLTTPGIGLGKHSGKCHHSLRISSVSARCRHIFLHIETIAMHFQALLLSAPFVYSPACYRFHIQALSSCRRARPSLTLSAFTTTWLFSCHALAHLVSALSGLSDLNSPCLCPKHIGQLVEFRIKPLSTPMHALTTQLLWAPLLSDIFWCCLATPWATCVLSPLAKDARAATLLSLGASMSRPGQHRSGGPKVISLVKEGVTGKVSFLIFS